MESGKYKAVLPIAEIDGATVRKARRLFSAYREKNVITEGAFEDDSWNMCDEYANYHLNFSLDSERYSAFAKRLGLGEDAFKDYLKTFAICQMGELVIISIQRIIHWIKELVYCGYDDLESFLRDECGNVPVRLFDFFSMIPQKGREEELSEMLGCFDDVVENIRASSNGGRRTLAAFESYFRFDEILDRFWADSDDEDEKLFYFPVWLWWKVSGVLPLRPREFVLIPRCCLSRMNDKYILKVRHNRIKGCGRNKSYKINEDYEIREYVIPEKLAKQIQWYIDRTNKCSKTSIDTLFVTETHYAMWERRSPHTSRYFSYVNLRTCLRYFYHEIVSRRYGYNVITENGRSSLENDKDIELIQLGDTRHIAMINLIAEGATQVVAMELAGHDNMETSAHYYSNITTLIECRTYRQYKKQVKGMQSYALSSFGNALRTQDFVRLEGKGRCFSPKTREKDFSDCCRASGPAGEIGYCQLCEFFVADGGRFRNQGDLYKNRIQEECMVLEEVIKKVRAGKGEHEDIISSLLRLRDNEYSYRNYILEKLELENGEK